MYSLTVVGVLLAVCGGAFSHSYHLGACPVVEPMSGFEMNKVSTLCLFVIYFIVAPGSEGPGSCEIVMVCGQA